MATQAQQARTEGSQVLIALLMLGYLLAGASQAQGDAGSLYREGLQSARAGDLRGAVSTWTSLLKQHRADLAAPQQAKILARLCVAFSRLDQPERAARCAAAAAALAPQNPRFLALSSRFSGAGHATVAQDATPQAAVAKALADVREALEAERLEAGRGRPTFERLEPFFRAKAAELVDPPACLLGLGACLSGLDGRTAEAEAALAESDRLAPGNPTTLLLLASAVERRGDAGPVIALLERALAAGAPADVVTPRLAKALARRGTYADAGRALALVQSLAAQDPAAAESLASSFDDLRLRDRALQLAAAARQAEDARERAEDAAARDARAASAAAQQASDPDEVQVGPQGREDGKAAGQYWQRRWLQYSTRVDAAQRAGLKAR